MTKTFRTALIEALSATSTSAQKLADATGVSVHQIKKLKSGKSLSTNVDDAVKIAHYFGKSLDQFLDDPSLASDVDIIGLLNRLSPQERDFLLSSAKGVLAARDHPQQ